VNEILLGGLSSVEAKHFVHAVPRSRNRMSARAGRWRIDVKNRLIDSRRKSSARQRRTSRSGPGSRIEEGGLGLPVAGIVSTVRYRRYRNSRTALDHGRRAARPALFENGPEPTMVPAKATGSFAVRAQRRKSKVVGARMGRPNSAPLRWLTGARDLAPCMLRQFVGRPGRRREGGTTVSVQKPNETIGKLGGIRLRSDTCLTRMRSRMAAPAGRPADHHRHVADETATSDSKSAAPRPLGGGDIDRRAEASSSERPDTSAARSRRMMAGKSGAARLAHQIDHDGT